MRASVSSGKSGAMFLFSGDGKYIIKTISKTERKFLSSFVNDYAKVNINVFHLVCLLNSL